MRIPSPAYIVDTPARWWRVYRERGFKGWLGYMVNFPRKFVPTKAGWIFFGFMLAIVVFAYTTNNNLLFLLFSAMMSLMVLSGMMSESSLGKIEVTRHFPQEIFARQPFTMGWTFSNFARKLGAYAFFPTDQRLLGDAPGPLVVRLPAGQAMRLDTPASLPRRGLVNLPPYRLVTQYPFLLFTKSREIEPDERVLVYPALRPVGLQMERLFGAAAEGERERREDGDRLSYLREYEPGEAMHKVDWKKSAKLDELYVKEFDRAETRRVRVVFEPGRAADIEPGISTCASVLVWLYNHHVPFALSAGALQQQRFSTDHAQLSEALRELAVFERGTTAPMAADDKRRLIIDGDGAIHSR